MTLLSRFCFAQGNDSPRTICTNTVVQTPSAGGWMDTYRSYLQYETFTAAYPAGHRYASECFRCQNEWSCIAEDFTKPPLSGSQAMCLSVIRSCRTRHVQESSWDLSLGVVDDGEKDGRERRGAPYQRSIDRFVLRPQRGASNQKTMMR